MGTNLPDPRTTLSCRKTIEIRRYGYETKIKDGLGGGGERGDGDAVRARVRDRKEMQHIRRIEILSQQRRGVV